MRILAIADEESKALWDYFDKSMLEGIDLIISCGDLDPRYLSFLVTFYSGPVLYVHGNHDGKYEQIPPEGCTCIEDKIFVYKGVRILGLGGSMRYKPGPHQYTEYEMKQRVARLWFKLFKKRGFDILRTSLMTGATCHIRDLRYSGNSWKSTGLSFFCTVMCIYPTGGIISDMTGTRIPILLMRMSGVYLISRMTSRRNI